MPLRFDTLSPLTPEQLATTELSHPELSNFDYEKDLRYVFHTKKIGREEISLDGLAIEAHHASDPRKNTILLYPKDGKAPFFEGAYKGHAIIFGDGEIIMAVVGIANAKALSEQTLGGKSIKVLTIPDNYANCFPSMVNAHKPQYIFTTHDKAEDLQNQFNNTHIVSYMATLDTALNNMSLDDLMNDKETIHYNEEWGELVPLIQSTRINNPYPVEAFGKLEEALQSFASRVQVPIGMAGNSLLGALSTVMQSFVDAPMGFEHKPVSLFLLTEAPSGAGKTQITNLIYRAIHDYDKECYQSFIEEMRAWEANKNSLSGKELKEFLESSKKPVNQSFLLTDATMEEVLDRYIISGLRSQSLSSSEAGQFFGGHSMKSTTSANSLSSLTTLWSDGKASRVRSTRSKDSIYHTNAYDCRFTLDLSGQRVILEPAINDPLLLGQGFLARCLLCCEPSLIGERDWLRDISFSDDYMDFEIVKFWDRCKELLRLNKELENKVYNADGSPYRYKMPFGKGAKRRLAEYQQEIEYQQKAGARLADHTAFASRMAENATRIATLLAFYEGYTTYEQSLKEKQLKLEIEHLERAFLLVEYSMNSWLHYNEMGGNEPNDTQKLINWLIKKCKEQDAHQLNWSSIYTNCPKPMLKNSKYLKEVLEVLENANYVRLTKEGRTQYIILNPKLLS